MIVGEGRFKYRVNADWAKLPDGWSFKEVGGVGVDGNDNVYVFNRGEHLVVAFGVGADPRQAAEMVQDNRKIRYGFGKGRELGQLWEAHPGVERQPHPRQYPGAGLVFGTGQHLFLFPALDLGMRVPSHRMADAAKPVRARRL